MFKSNWIIAQLTQRYPGALYSVDTEQPIVALTIDDAPDPTTTPRILDILREHGARATFFLITSRVRGNEAVVRRMVAEGHELGNHLTTDQPSIRLGLFEFERRLREAHDTLARFAKVHWFRPGSGWYTRAMLSILADYGYRCALGSVYPYDAWLPSTWFSTRYVLGRVEAGSIIVLHDGGGRGRRTAAALSVILPELRRRGLRVVTLSQLAELEQPPNARTRTTNDT